MREAYESLQRCRQALEIAAECADAAGEYRMAGEIRDMVEGLPTPSLSQLLLDVCGERVA